MTARTRADAGVPRLTARDASALAWLSQMYGAPQDIVARLLGTTLRRSYAVTRRWEDPPHRLVRTLPVPPAAYRWVIPHPATAAEYLGWTPAPWRPTLGTAGHLAAVAAVRLALRAATVDGWISQRVLRHRAEIDDQVEESADADSVDGLASLGDGRVLRVQVLDTTPADPSGVVRRHAEHADRYGAPTLCVASPAAAPALHRAATGAAQVGVVRLDELTAATSPAKAWSSTAWLAALQAPDDMGDTDR
jgi:hypothetical protein